MGKSKVLVKVHPEGKHVDPLVNLMKVEKVPDSTYDMIGGLDQQIKEIKEVIELPIKHPELFESLGIAQAKGVLLYGPPGTGKTLLARAVAHHTDCTFVRVSGSELVQKYIGEGSRMAREHSPVKQNKSSNGHKQDRYFGPRIDRKIEFPNPNEESRFDILKIHSRDELDAWNISQKNCRKTERSIWSRLRLCAQKLGCLHSGKGEFM
ncbi:hypothetical protein OPV22_027394 [Ensete ventricosum]|uniref:ATPase AAA-type core domain-containing protein n=1 Tax=Ensete ventricosum TaxID=4639 RepID=A0AAV8PVJ3_ENSVE|nr:hypothetical protein OPV22_027394 [Ensete ventricosum]